MTNSYLLIQQLPLLPIIWSGSPNEQKGTTAWAGSIISITTVVSSKLILKIYNLTGLYFVDITTVCSTSQTNITVPTLQYSLQLTRLKTRIVSLIYQSTQTGQPKNPLFICRDNCYWNINNNCYLFGSSTTSQGPPASNIARNESTP